LTAFWPLSTWVTLLPVRTFSAFQSLGTVANL
jgi:hypothetical protein